jgi:hypothetical protein
MIILSSFKPQQAEEEREKDDDVEEFLLPFMAFQKVPNNEDRSEPDHQVIENGDDHRRSS